MAMAPYDGNDRRSNEWQLKKEVSVGDLIAIVAAIAAASTAYFSLDKRLSLLEQSTFTQQKVDQRQDDESIRYQARIDATLLAINGKLDRLIEAKK